MADAVKVKGDKSPTHVGKLVLVMLEHVIEIESGRVVPEMSFVQTLVCGRVTTTYAEVDS